MKLPLRLLFTVLILAVVLGCGTGKKQKTDAEISEINSFSKIEKNVVPNFVLADLKGDMVEFDKEFKGKVVLLNFWATWCPPCIKEIPELIKLHKKYKSEGFSVVGITVDEILREEIEQFVQKNSMDFPILGNIKSQESFNVGYAIAEAAGIRFTGIPTTYLIDRNGKIVKSYIGPRSEEFFYNDIKPLL